MTSGDAPKIGAIVTAPGCAEQKGRNGTWRVLAKLSVSSEPGNERLAMERVATVVKELGLSEQRLERLKTAVGEATMNAMEHGSRYRPEVPVVIEVLSSGVDLSVRISDQGKSLVPDPDREVPDLKSKLKGLQMPRGWGLFLTVVCWSGIYWLGSIEIGSLGPINTLPLDRNSNSPESQSALLPDINKPPLIRNMVDEMHITSDEVHHTVGLVMHL